MRYLRYIRFALLFGFLFAATGAQSQQEVEGSGYNLLLKTLLDHSVPELSVKELATDKNQYILLDSREAKEFKVSHIQGALPVGYDSFDISSVEGIAKDAPIVVYCSVGYRSEKIAEKLIDAGFTDVHNLYGGIFEWVNDGNEVFDANGQTEKVHVYSRTWGIWCNCEEKVSD